MSPLFPRPNRARFVVVPSIISTLGFVLSPLILSRPATAQGYNDPYGLKRQQREWQDRTNHYNSWMSDIRSRQSKSSSNEAPELVWKSNAQKEREWKETLSRLKAESGARDARDAAWQAHLDAYSAKIKRQADEENRLIEAENAEVRAMNERNRDSVHKQVREAFGGMATAKRPPIFATRAQEFNWYLTEAKAGDQYAEFRVGRNLLEGIGVTRDEVAALSWLEKTNLEWGEPAALLGTLLITGKGGKTDVPRGLELLERGSKNDKWGVGAWLAGNLYESLGTPDDIDKAALHFARAAIRSNRQNPWDAWTPRCEWGPPEKEWAEQSKLMRRAFDDFVYAHPDRIKWWVRGWNTQSVIFEAQLLKYAALGAPPETGGKPQAAYLETVQAGESPWSDNSTRTQFLDVLRVRNHPNLATYEAKAKEQIILMPDYTPLRLRMEKRAGGRTEAELEEAHRDLIASDELPDGQERANKLMSAFEKGDALAGWAILESPWKQGEDLYWMAEVTHERFLRDAKGTGERAASAALALYYWHDNSANGNGRRYGRSSWMYGIKNLGDDDGTKWLQMAVDKGHPIAIQRAGVGDGFDYIDPDKKPQKWADVETILAKAVENEKWWRRDARVFSVRGVEDSISSAKRRVEMLRAARADARYFTEISTNLDAARTFCLERGGTFGNESRSSTALLNQCFATFNLDSTDRDNLPFRRSKALQLSVEAAVMGDGWAAFTVGEILEKAPFPYPSNKEESRRWLGAGRVLLERTTKSPDRFRANDAALFLGNQLVKGELLPRDTKAGLHLLEFAAIGGHYRAASDLSSFYKYGEHGIKADPTLATKWEKLSYAIVEGKYQPPATASPAKTAAKPAVSKKAPLKTNLKATNTQKKS